MLKKKHVSWAVSQDSITNNVAVRNFAEAFYRYPPSSKENCLCFKEAYKVALNHLKRHGWLIANLEDYNVVLKEQKD